MPPTRTCVRRRCSAPVLGGQHGQGALELGPALPSHKGGPGLNKLGMVDMGILAQSEHMHAEAFFIRHTYTGWGLSMLL